MPCCKGKGMGEFVKQRCYNLLDVFVVRGCDNSALIQSFRLSGLTLWRDKR